MQGQRLDAENLRLSRTACTCWTILHPDQGFRPGRGFCFSHKPPAAKNPKKHLALFPLFCYNILDIVRKCI